MDIPRDFRGSIEPVWPVRRLDRSLGDRSLPTILTDAAVSISLRFGRWMELRASRSALLELSDEQLRDIGLTRGDALAEARRPFDWT